MAIRRGQADYFYVHLMFEGLYMKSFILGLGVGTAIGLLIAPQEGGKTRSEWAQRLRNWFGDDSERNLEQTRAEVEQESVEVAEVLRSGLINVSTGSTCKQVEPYRESWCYDVPSAPADGGSS